ncbi:MAG: tetratricopeptide repeat protein, partial [Planctomycetota bacterium]
MRIRCLLIVLLLAGATISLRPIWGASATDRLLSQAAGHLMADRYDEAESCALGVLQDDPQSSLALLIAGEVASHRQRDDDAIRYFRQVPDDGSPDAIRALNRAAERLVADGRAREAEQCLRCAVNHDPSHTITNRALAVLLQKQGRTWESWPFASRVLLNGHISKSQMVVTGAIDTTFVEDYQFVENCLAKEPGDSAVLLGRARTDLTKSRFDSAETLLRRILSEHPDSLEARARLGGVLLNGRPEEEFLQWQRSLPSDAVTHPEIWYTQGLWARRNGQNQAAVRCFLEAALRDPNHAGAVFQLSQLLSETEYSDLAEPLAARSKQLSQLRYLLMEIRDGYETQLVRKAIGLLDDLDRPLEAAAWCQVLQVWNLDNADWAKREKPRLIGRLSGGHELTLPSGQLVAHIDRNQFPLPDWSASAARVNANQGTSPIPGKVSFANVAAEVGIDFDYFNGTTAETGLVHILQATGGGVAVIDFDLDGWQDLYFVQSGPFPITTGETRYTNRLYRNLGAGPLGSGRFDDVSGTAGV